MKVLQINATWGRGSTGKIVRDIQQISTSEGVDSYVAYSLTTQRDVPNGYHVGNFVDAKSHALLSRLHGCQAYFSSCSTRRFLHWMDKLQPDVVHLHNLHSNYINLNMLLSYLAEHNIRTIITMHDCWYFTGGCFHYVSVGCEKWKRGCHDCQKHDTPAWFGDSSQQIWSDRLRYLRAIPRLTVVGCSEWIAGEAAKSPVLEGRDIRTIYNGFDLNIFRPSTPKTEKIQSLLSVASGRHIILGPATKWLSDINAETFNYFASHLPQDNILVLFGGGGGGMTLPKNVISFGFTSDADELAQLYSVADVMVNCSREDTLSSINIECQACGTPVVTYDATGLKETVDNSVSVAVKTGDYKALLDATFTILSQSRDINVLTDWVTSKFEKGKNYKKYMDLYHEQRIESES